MYVGYDDAGEQACPYADLDEYLCEYVDGEMDPAVRAVFEEILSRDPALAEHVECLCQTRALLCTFSQGVDTPFGFQARLHREISRELLVEQAPVLTTVAAPLRRAVAMASLLALAMTAGFYVAQDGLEIRAASGAQTAAVPHLAASAAQDGGSLPLYWSAAPVLVSAEQPHYRISYERGVPQLEHALHTQSTFGDGLGRSLPLMAAYKPLAPGGTP